MLDPNDPRTGLRISRVLGLVATACLVAAAMAPAQARGQVRSFSCANGQAFTAQVSDRSATIKTRGATFDLARRASSIGIKYSSPSATLIIDESFASLIGRDLQRFERCYATSSFAKLR